jgi:D-xylose 1-dehydrogenase (NADP+, D-xylono-1,5-lactone-forming)
VESLSESKARLRFGILGAADIARKALIPAIEAAPNAELVAIASRDRKRGRALFGGWVAADYAELLEDPDVDAVYIPLPNGLHKEWTIRALAAGKHVLCEKPLANTAADAVEMAEAAHAAGRLLMEAVMYRFHPNIQAVVEKLREKPPEEIWASFGFPLREPANIRFDPDLGGGALLDVGTYTISLARWIYGEPDWVEATGRVEEVDMTVSMTLGFASGARAHLFASFDTPEVQELHAGDLLLDKPFTAWRDPVDPYQVMVEEFSAAALAGLPAPLSLEDSIANLRVVDAVRQSLETGSRHHLAETGESLPPIAE